MEALLWLEDRVWGVLCLNFKRLVGTTSLAYRKAARLFWLLHSLCVGALTSKQEHTVTGVGLYRVGSKYFLPRMWPSFSTFTSKMKMLVLSPDSTMMQSARYTVCAQQTLAAVSLWWPDVTQHLSGSSQMLYSSLICLLATVWHLIFFLLDFMSSVPSSANHSKLSFCFPGHSEIRILFSKLYAKISFLSWFF